jgi:hypothetical protein
LAPHTNNNYHEYAPKNETTDLIQTLDKRTANQMLGEFPHPGLSKIKVYYLMSKVLEMV